MHCLRSATHCCASYLLSAPSQLRLHSRQYFFNSALCVCLEVTRKVYFSKAEFIWMEHFSENKKRFFF